MTYIGGSLNRSRALAESSSKNAAIAAGVILACVAGLFLVMPWIVTTLGEVSPWLGYGVTVLFILGFFAIFWLRSRYQRAHRDGS